MAQVVKNLPANAGDARDKDSIPGSGKAPGEGNGNPRQYFCLGNPMDRVASWATTILGVAESDRTEHVCILDCSLPDSSAHVHRVC